MKAAQLKTLAAIRSSVEDLKIQLEEIATAAREEYDNKSERAQESEKGQVLEGHASSLESAVESLEGAVQSIEEVTGGLD